MDLKAYLRRIGLQDFPTNAFTPSLPALRELHLHHLLSVPFESLSIHIGEKVIFHLPWIYQKIVLWRRGGFCFEQNALLWWVLGELGFQRKFLSGRVRNSDSGVYGPPHEHMILAVELDGRRWLCDVGLGDGIISPLPLEAEWEEQQMNGRFRLHVEGEDWYLQRREGDLWKVHYRFTLEERRFEDFREVCEYHQTSPISVFVRKSFCSLLLPRGRLTYMGHRLISTEYSEEGGIEKTTRDLSDEEIPDILRDKFGIFLNAKLVPKHVVLPPQSTE